MKQNVTIAKIREYLLSGYTIEEATKKAGEVFVSCETTRKASERKKVGELTFGVEIECLLLPNTDINAKFTEAGVINHNSIGHYNHTDSETSYKVMTDASVCGSGYDNREIVSPILRNFDTLKKVCEVLRANGAIVNSTCGLHVHIGAKNFTQRQIVNICHNYGKLEGVIDTFMAESRRASNKFFCQSIAGFDFSKAKNINEAYKAMGGEKDIASSTRTDRRYYKVNLEAYGQHNTIEFRQHQGTLNIKKITFWVEFLRKLCKWSKTNRLEANVENIDDILFLNDDEKAFFKARAVELS